MDRFFYDANYRPALAKSVPRRIGKK